MQFRYLRDPLFVFCVLLYFVNRWVFKPATDGGFCHACLNDLVCIPFWVPIMLLTMRRLGLRADDSAPKSYEIIVPLLVWSFVFELVLPRLAVFRGLAFSDHLDILFYAVGALLASVFWKAWYPEQRPAAHDPPLPAPISGRPNSP